MENPKTKQLGFAMEVLDMGNKPPTIYFAGSVMYNCSLPLVISGQPIIKITSPTLKAEPYQLSAKFFNQKGELSLEIINNEWRSYMSNWDMEVTAGRIKIMNNKQTYNLVLKSIKYNEIEIELIEGVFGDLLLKGDRNQLTVTNLLNGNSISYINNLHYKAGLVL